MELCSKAKRSSVTIGRSASSRVHLMCARLQPNSLDFLQIEGDHVHHLPDALFSVEWPWLLSNSVKLLKNEDGPTIKQQLNKDTYYVKAIIHVDLRRAKRSLVNYQQCSLTQLVGCH